MKAYHASNYVFDRFSSDYVMTMPGLWFSEDKDYAMEYGAYLYEVELAVKHPLDLDSEEGNTVIHEYLKKNRREKTVTTEKFRSYLLDRHYDAIQWQRYGKLTVVVLNAARITILERVLVESDAPDLAGRAVGTSY